MSEHAEYSVRDENVTVFAQEADVVVEIGAGRPHRQLTKTFAPDYYQQPDDAD